MIFSPIFLVFLQTNHCIVGIHVIRKASNRYLFHEVMEALR